MYLEELLERYAATERDFRHTTFATGHDIAFLNPQKISLDALPIVLIDAVTNCENSVEYYLMKEVITMEKVGSKIIVNGINLSIDSYGTRRWKYQRLGLVPV